ncbi:MAG: hypothetical protein M1836_002003 [Candelina mexicana]|nr:MAG: hypothetical protein M1836_002003 [Candelina mexicana]
MAKPLGRSRSFRALLSNSELPKENTQPAPRRLQKQQRPREISPAQYRDTTSSPRPRKPLMRSRSQTKGDQPDAVKNTAGNESHYPGVNPLASHTSSMFFTPMPQAAAEPPPYAPCDELAIGMALGSPRDNPQWSSEPPLPVPSNDNHNDSRTTVSSPAPSQISNDRSQGGPTLKHKGSRWKLLGGMFGRKTTESSPSSSFNQVQHPSSSPRTPQSNTPKTTEVLRERSIKRRANPRIKEQGEGKPNLKRAQTSPLSQSEAAPKPPPKSTQSSLRPARAQLEGGRMLDVDIPNTKLDRYSVMFDAVLKPTQPATQPQSSLLARRQANQISDHEHLQMARPATSPSPTKAPSFLLLPANAATSSRDPSPTPSALRRTVTAPSAISPIRNTFELYQTPESESRIILMVHSPAKETFETPARVLKRNPSYDRSLPSSPQSFDTAESYFPDVRKEPSWGMLSTPGEKTLPRSPGSAGAEASVTSTINKYFAVRRNSYFNLRVRSVSPREKSNAPVKPVYSGTFTKEEKDQLYRLSKKSWILTQDGKALEKSFQFPSFKDTWDYMETIVIRARSERHHPEWANSFDKLFIRWTTHEPSGLSVKDVRLAKYCDVIAAAWQDCMIAGKGSYELGFMKVGKGLLKGLAATEDEHFMEAGRNEIGVVNEDEHRGESVEDTEGPEIAEEHNDDRVIYSVPSADEKEEQDDEASILLNAPLEHKRSRDAVLRSLPHAAKEEQRKEASEDRFEYYMPKFKQTMLLSEEQDQDEEQYLGGHQGAERYIIRVLENKADFLRDNLDERYERHIQRVLNLKRVSLRRKLGLSHDNEVEAGDGLDPHEVSDQEAVNWNVAAEGTKPDRDPFIMDLEQGSQPIPQQARVNEMTATTPSADVHDDKTVDRSAEPKHEEPVEQDVPSRPEGGTKPESKAKALSAIDVQIDDRRWKEDKKGYIKRVISANRENLSKLVHSDDSIGIHKIEDVLIAIWRVLDPRSPKGFDKQKKVMLRKLEDLRQHLTGYSPIQWSEIAEGRSAATVGTTAIADKESTQRREETDKEYLDRMWLSDERALTEGIDPGDAGALSRVRDVLLAKNWALRLRLTGASTYKADIAVHIRQANLERWLAAKEHDSGLDAGSRKPTSKAKAAEQSNTGAKPKQAPSDTPNDERA